MSAIAQNRIPTPVVTRSDMSAPDGQLGAGDPNLSPTAVDNRVESSTRQTSRDDGRRPPLERMTTVGSNEYVCRAMVFDVWHRFFTGLEIREEVFRFFFIFTRKPYPDALRHSYDDNRYSDGSDVSNGVIRQRGMGPGMGPRRGGPIGSESDYVDTMANQTNQQGPVLYRR